MCKNNKIKHIEPSSEIFTEILTDELVPFQGKDRIVIGIPRLQSDGTRKSLKFPIQGFKGTSILYFTVSNENLSFLSLQSDSALVALLIPAMKMGKDIKIKGNVS